MASTTLLAQTKTTTKSSTEPSKYSRIETAKVEQNPKTQEMANPVYMVVDVMIDGDKVSVKPQKSNAKVDEMSARYSEKMYYQMEKSAQEFQTEADVLNYMTTLGMEFICATNNLDRGNVKTFYFKMNQ